MKHTESELKQMQSLPLEAKVEMTRRRIREWYDYWDGQVCLSFSGGKDSTVLKHIIETTSGVYDVPCVFVDTGLEYPEVKKFATANADVILRPKMRFDKVIKEYGYPVFSKQTAKRIEYGRKALQRGNPEVAEKYLFPIRKDKETGETFRSNFKPSKKAIDVALNTDIPISGKCCDIMKKNPLKKYQKETGRKPILGMMAGESKLRENAWLLHGCNAFESKNPSSSPLAFWTEQDVLQYIVENNIDYATVYGEIKQDENGKYYTTGVNRTGCMFCMFGVHLEKNPNRFQKMKETHPIQYAYCMKPMAEGGLGIAEILDYIGVEYK